MTNTITLASTERTERLSLIREAFRLEWLTIAWMTVEAVVAIASSIAAGSLVLLAFGRDRAFTSSDDRLRFLRAQCLKNAALLRSSGASVDIVRYLSA
jgi:hypothetical protein